MPLQTLLLFVVLNLSMDTIISAMPLIILDFTFALEEVLLLYTNKTLGFLVQLELLANAQLDLLAQMTLDHLAESHLLLTLPNLFVMLSLQTLQQWDIIALQTRKDSTNAYQTISLPLMASKDAQLELFADVMLE